MTGAYHQRYMTCSHCGEGAFVEPEGFDVVGFTCPICMAGNRIQPQPKEPITIGTRLVLAGLVVAYVAWIVAGLACAVGMVRWALGI
jgi:hypothetical protein